MNYCTPEKMGISSADIQAYLELLERSKLATHDLIIMRKDQILFEHYWKPFHKDFQHRMYSATKSFVSLAIGFLEQDGLIGLDDKLIDYFPEEAKQLTDDYFRALTIRQMLMMRTAKQRRSWFPIKPQDRVLDYFQNPSPTAHHAGTFFEYDSNGSFILGALVERVSGKTLMDYLREKFLDKIGFSEEADMLACPGGHSWSDSALICKATDLLKAAQFCMHKGNWNGEQLLNEKYIEEATACQVSTITTDYPSYIYEGYGYQFWRTHDNSYFFNGMGCQYAICVPDKDLIVIYNGDNQGNDYAKLIIINALFDLVIRKAQDAPMEENSQAQKALAGYCSTLELFHAKGAATSPMAERINGKTFALDTNPMGITKLKITFDEGGGTLAYTNAQGDKELSFGINANRFGKFPQKGYADRIGTVPGDRLFDCAASAAWADTNTFFIDVQVIDTYFGRLQMIFSFREDLKLGIKMIKKAEDFMNEYEGIATGDLTGRI